MLRKMNGGVHCSKQYLRSEGRKQEMSEKETHLQGHHAKDSRGYSPASEHDDPSLLVRSEVRRGPLPGDVRVCIVRPRSLSFRRVRTGLLEATEETEAPRNTLERLLIGTPLTAAQAEHERLTKFKALAVLSSDAISSVAYATEAILVTLIAAGSSSLGLTLPISIAIVGLLCIVTLSYRQTIPAYPKELESRCLCINKVRYRTINLLSLYG